MEKWKCPEIDGMGMCGVLGKECMKLDPECGFIKTECEKCKDMMDEMGVQLRSCSHCVNKVSGVSSSASSS